MFYILFYRRIPYMSTSCDNRVSDSMDSLKNIISVAICMRSFKHFCDDIWFINKSIYIKFLTCYAKKLYNIILNIWYMLLNKNIKIIILRFMRFLSN